MLTLDQKALIYRDAVILSMDRRDSVAAQIFSRVKEGAYGLESRDIEEVTAFYMENLDSILNAVTAVNGYMDCIVMIFKGGEYIKELTNGGD